MEDAQQPRWLTDEQQEIWQGTIGLLMLLPSALDAQMRRDAGISHFDYAVLSRLSTAPERTMRMSALADGAKGSLSRLSQVVAKLETKGWVRRMPDPADGRNTLAVLTDAGRDKVVAAAPGHVDEVRRLVFDPLTIAQQRQLGAIGRRVTRAVNQGDDCA